MNKKVLILGAGGFARELVSLMRFDSTFFAGFLSDNVNEHGKMLLGLPIIGNIESIDKDKYFFVCGVGDPDLKSKFVSRLNGARFVTLNPWESAINHISYGLQNELGEGSVICSGSSITTNVKIGKHVAVNLNCTIGHDTIIKDFVTIAPGCNISGNVSIGEKTELGTNVIILPKISVGKNCLLGAGAVVNKNIPDNSVAVGIPAKIIKQR